MARRNTVTDRIIVKARCPFCRRTSERWSDKDIAFESVEQWKSEFRQACKMIGEMALAHDCPKDPAKAPANG